MSLKLERAMAPDGFVGRTRELERLTKLLERVTDSRRDPPGVVVTLRGRRRVGKSRLVEVFCERAGVPWVFFQATQGADAGDERAAFTEAVRDSDLPDRDLFDAEVELASWAAVFRQLASAVPDDSPCIVVIDELPWLIEGDERLEGALQTAWDKWLSRKPVLFVLIGSDLAMMERLDDYRRPFHQRATMMTLPALNPAEVGSMLSLGPAEAIDAYLVTGGLPLICQEWAQGDGLEEFLTTSLSEPTSALLVSGERSLAAEFPAQLQPQEVLSAIGNGERTFSGIMAKLSGASGHIAASSLSKAIRQLEQKRVVAVDTPLSIKPATKERRYRVADPYLRFYLAFLRAGLPLIERGRPDLLFRRIRRSWTSWRGRAVEPIIREALLRITPELGWEDVEEVGGWWNRQNNPEIDLVGADRPDVATRILFAGSIKWHATCPFDRHDYAALVRDSAAIPGADESTELLAASRSGTSGELPARCVTPDELIAAWAA